MKQVDAIGPHHRSWPIRDGPQQTRLTRSSVSASQENATNSVEVDNNGACRQTSAFTKSLQSSKTKSNTRPSANLSLFEPEDDFNAQNKKAIETSHQDRTGDSSNLNTKRFSPPKGDLQSSSQPRVETDWVLTPKPASKTFNHFEFGEAEVPVSSTKRTKEHEHFEFGEAKVPSPSTQSKFNKSQSHFDIGEAPPPLPTTKADIPIHSRPSKHASQWDFEDFVTPEKPRQKVRGQNVRHFAWSDDDCEPMETPQRKPRIIHPRRDAAPHFEFEDEGTEVDAQMPLRNTAGATHNKGLKLYENNLYSEVSDTESDKVVNSQVPTSSTNVSRRKDLESHWDMTDEPLIDSTTKVDHSQQNCSDHLKAVKMMDSNWDIYGGGMDGNDDSMVKGPKKSTRKVNQPSWSLGDESP